jgi:phosphoenolpyruvate carboxykinase (ATP)
MRHSGPVISQHGLENLGIRNASEVYWNLPPAQLYEHALRRGEGVISAEGPLIVNTGVHTGRSPNDKFVADHPSTHDNIWWGKVNRPLAPAAVDALLGKVQAFVQGRDLYVFDGYAGADPRYRLPVRIVTQFAWHNLFAYNMFVRESRPEVLRDFTPAFTVVDVPGLEAEPATDGTRTGTFIVLDLEKKLALVGGTEYAGEIKKGIFTVMNYLLPAEGVMPMHCSANYGANKSDVALFFGLSGTGKTTLSADPARTLIGDDEHGWSDDGVFNFEGGCYAKVIRLDPQGEPDIFNTTRTFGTILENVGFDAETRRLDLNDDRRTENTRSSYPLTQIPNVDLGGVAGHPKNVIFLTCDAYGVLPPITRLSEGQAMYQFLSGYTAKVAGTEKGVTEPSATFSTCFGAPFMPRHPGVYAKLLGEKLRHHQAKVWLVNTGWTGGVYGVGKRIKLSLTRRMVHAALGGELDAVATRVDPIFGLAVPVAVDGVPNEVLDPRASWADKAAYDERAKKLAAMFRDNFKQFEDGVDDEIRAAAPPG